MSTLRTLVLFGIAVVTAGLTGCGGLMGSLQGPMPDMGTAAATRTLTLTGDIGWPASLGAVTDVHVAVYSQAARLAGGSETLGTVSAGAGTFTVTGLPIDTYLVVEVDGKTAAGTTARLSAVVPPVGRAAVRGRDQGVVHVSGASTIVAEAVRLLLAAGTPASEITTERLAALEASAAPLVATTDFTSPESITAAAQQALTAPPTLNAPPQIAGVSASPTTVPSAGGTVTFNAQVTDDQGVAHVWAEITPPAGQATTIELAAAGGASYSGAWSAPANGSTQGVTYTSRILAQDTAGLSTTSAGPSITVVGVGTITDRDGPAISNAASSPNSLRFPGGQVSVGASVSDPSGVAAVWAEIAAPGGSTSRLDLAAGSGAAYSAKWTAPPNTNEQGTAQTYSVRVYARDGAGNQSAADPVTVTVAAPGTAPSGPPAL